MDLIGSSDPVISISKSCVEVRIPSLTYSENDSVAYSFAVSWLIVIAFAQFKGDCVPIGLPLAAQKQRLRIVENGNAKGPKPIDPQAPLKRAGAELEHSHGW